PCSSSPPTRAARSTRPRTGSAAPPPRSSSAGSRRRSGSSSPPCSGAWATSSDVQGAPHDGESLPRVQPQGPHRLHVRRCGTLGGRVVVVAAPARGRVGDKGARPPPADEKSVRLELAVGPRDG